MSLIPKPIQITQQIGSGQEVQPIKVQPPMPPGQAGDVSLAQTIMGFLQG
jgi:hypothetical protein